jgi:hypothetical protein
MQKALRASKLSFSDVSRLKSELRREHLAMKPERAQAIASSVGDGKSLHLLHVRSL